MRCDVARELLDLYVDEELPEETAVQVERHLLRCPECAFDVSSLERTRALLRESETPEECSPSFRERALARLTDTFADRLHPRLPAAARQWSLPFDGSPRILPEERA